MLYALKIATRYLTASVAQTAGIPPVLNGVHS